MRICKAIGYNCYNSAIECPRAIKPWLPHIDYVIAIDGRHKTPLPPHLIKNKPMPDYSTDNTKEVLEEICDSKLVYEKYCGTQIEKRQRYLDIAGKLDCDVLIVFDTDDYIHPEYQDWNRFEAQLDSMVALKDGASVAYMWGYIPTEELWPKQYNAVPSETWQRYLRIHKNPGEQRYILNHYTFTTKKILETVTEQEIAKSVNDYGVTKSPYILHPGVYRTLEGIRFTTDRIFRSENQLEFGDGWAFQEAREDDYKMINFWRIDVGLEPIPLDKPHYYDETGKLIWY